MMYPVVGDTVEIIYGIYEGHIGTVVAGPLKDNGRDKWFPGDGRKILVVEIHDYQEQVGDAVTCPTVTVWEAYCDKVNNDPEWFDDPEPWYELPSRLFR